MNPNFDGIHSPNGMDLHSPNDMLLDSDEFVTEIPEDEKDDVAIIDPDQLSNGAEALPKRPSADDYEAMKAEVLPPLQEQPRILADAVNTWKIEDWHRLPKKHHGPIFEAGGYPWRILMFPYGNNVEFCSFYLEQGFPDSKPPDDYTCCAQFALVMWNPKDPTIWTTHHAHHRFTKEEGDWGFTRYLEMRKLFNVAWPGSNRPMVENDCVNMTAYVRVVEDETGVLWHGFTNYDSKKATGFVGLKNQGATCYLNSLIQTLYFTNAFRKAVYQIPTQDEQDLANSAYTLQRLFYQLQMSSTAVGTNELTKSFGWDARAIFEQQDVQELSRKLMERMEEKMKGTEAENALSKLFCGKVRTYISCINVTYESRRVEDFWDLQLNVAGNKNLEDSFKEYIEVETMDGENRYYAGEEFKLQDANKGVIFESLPEVLHLQLKRFQFDFDSESMKKVNDRFEFPETFDAAPFLADDADKSESWVYQLHGVLVHSGDLNAGHYYAFIKPNKDGWFYKYDDDRVTKATLREVLEENFGGEYLPPNGQIAPQRTTPILRQNSAYMLVYIRQSRVDNVLQPVTKEDTPEHLQKKLDEEAAIREARRKEREEAPLYLNVRVITEDTFKLYGGTDLTAFEHQHETDPAAARSYRLLRKSTIADLAVTVAKDIDQDPKRLRFWCMVNRQNKTIRPDSPIGNPNITIEEAYQQLSGSKEPHLRLWAESAEEVGPDGEAIWPSHQPDQNGTLPKTDLIVLFLKEFDMENQVLRGVGHIYISRDKKVEDLVPAINKKMGWEKVRLRLWEEIKPQMVDPMKAKATLKAAELQDGDIICFQRDNTDTRSSIETKNSTTESDQSMSIPLITNLVARADLGSVPKTSVVDRFDDAMKYYEFLIYKRIVHFAPHPTRGLVPDGGWERFSLTLSTKWSYDQVTIKLGEKLGVDPTHIRLWTWNSTTNNPKSTVKRQQQQILASMLNPGYSTFSNNNQRADSFFFEVLDMSLSELDTKKSLKVTWLSEGVSKEEILDILVPKNGVVEDIITGILKKTQIDDEVKGGPIRVYEVHSSKINRELAREASVTNITEYTTLVAERVPEEEIAEPQHSIQVYHFHGEPTKAYGTPFKFLLKELETFAETKKRLEKRTGIKGKNFEKIKFAVVKRSAYSKPIYLGDDDVLWDLAPNEDDMLGLDHVDRTRSRGNGAGDLTLK